MAIITNASGWSNVIGAQVDAVNDVAPPVIAIQQNKVVLPSPIVLTWNKNGAGKAITVQVSDKADFSNLVTETRLLNPDGSGMNLPQGTFWIRARWLESNLSTV